MMKSLFTKVIMMFAISVFVVGCGLPRGAAVQSEILDIDDSELPGFAVYPVTRSLLTESANWPRTGGVPNSGWIKRQRGPSTQIIASGDEINLTVWDSEENSLLTAAEEKVVALEGIKVSSDGSIFMPYVERVFISGMTPDEAREIIQQKMEVIVPAAQVQLSLLPGARNSVDLVGGVSSPGRFALESRDMTVLSLLSLGGGVPDGLRNPLIRLNRDGKIYMTSLARLYANPSLDTTLRGGDKVIVEEDIRSFISLGAAGTQDVVYFSKDRLTALEAVSLIGGVQNRRADPQAILILRNYPDNSGQPGVVGPREPRVIFAMDLTSPDGLFSAKKFEVHPDDLVYPTESVATMVEFIFNIVGSAFGVVNRFPQ
ncbi:MAG: polysaccharide biosynthesis/export family protein [Pseudoruegeria sp.]